MPELKPCGTPAAYRRHLRHGEQACVKCLRAEAEARRAPGTPPRRPAQHGTPSKYRKGCRCEACTRAHREDCYERRKTYAELAQSQPEAVPHGRSGYVNYGCRCEACAKAERDYQREYRAAQRAERAAAR